LGDVTTILIERNTTIPTRRSVIFTTAFDHQNVAGIHVLRGDRPMARDDISLGSFYLDGIPPAPRGIPQIEVTFDVDANSILNVTAKDKATGKKQKITIMPSMNSGNSSNHRMKENTQIQIYEDESKKKEDRDKTDLKSHILQDM